MLDGWSESSASSTAKVMVTNVNNGDDHSGLDYKTRYRNLKRKLKFLIYENESFQEALRSTQQRLLKTNRDRSFLLDRLLQYEKVEQSSSESDETDSTDGEESLKPEPNKRKKFETAYNLPSPNQAASSKTQSSAKKRKPATPKVTIKQNLQQELPSASPLLADGHMTPEEVERHLESRHSYMELVPERAPPTVPTEMFSNEPSLDSFCYSESNEVGEVETSPSMGDDCLSVELPE